MHVAVEFGRLDYVRRLVEEHKVDINATCGLTGYTPLMFACQTQELEIAQYLCERGADLRQVSICGRTALQISVEMGHGRLIEFLSQR